MEPSSSGRPTRSLPEQRSSAEFPPNERVRCPCRDDGGGEIVRFFARLDLGTAFATLIRQRHAMPSCGGLAPTAERTVDSARMIEESLRSNPGIREQKPHCDGWQPRTWYELCSGHFAYSQPGFHPGIGLRTDKRDSGSVDLRISLSRHLRFEWGFRSAHAQCYGAALP